MTMTSNRRRPRSWSPAGASIRSAAGAGRGSASSRGHSTDPKAWADGSLRARNGTGRCTWPRAMSRARTGHRHQAFRRRSATSPKLTARTRSRIPCDRQDGRSTRPCPRFPISIQWLRPPRGHSSASAPPGTRVPQTCVARSCTACLPRKRSSDMSGGSRSASKLVRASGKDGCIRETGPRFRSSNGRERQAAFTPWSNPLRAARSRTGPFTSARRRLRPIPTGTVSIQGWRPHRCCHWTSSHMVSVRTAAFPSTARRSSCRNARPGSGRIRRS